MRMKGIATALGTSVCLIALATPAHAQERSFDIPAGNLKTALDAYSRQAGQPIIYKPEEVRGARSQGFKGAATASAALDAVLTGSGFSAHSGSTGAIAIVRTGSPQGNAVAGGPNAGSKNPTSSLGEAADSTTAANANEAIVVTGSRLRRNAGDEGPSPVAVLDRHTIDRSGASNVADVLRNMTQVPYSSNDSSTALGGARTVQLRGLSTGSTLVLINGRRTTTSPEDALANIFDLNTIPLSAVDRVEVLSDTASAIYGADAVGGVVNIILKDRIDAPQLDLYYGGAQGGAIEKRASLSAGYSTRDFKGTLTLDAFHRSELQGSQRSLTSDGNYRRFGSSDLRVKTADPGNICSTNGANLPGLSAPCAAVPAGSTGVGLTPSSFAATAGQTNFFSRQFDSSLIPDTTRYSLAGTAEYSFNADLTAYAELLAAHRVTDANSSPATISNQLVPASNAFNPFGVPVRATYLFAGIGPRDDRTVDDYWRPVVGLKGSLGTWDWDVSGMYTRDIATDETLNNINSAAVVSALASGSSASALNVFQDGPGGSPALLATLLARPVVNHYDSKSWQGSAFARGSLFRLPAGDANAVIGGEFRSEALGFNSSGVVISASRTVSALYSELRLPLVSSDMSVPGVNSLTATAAARYDRYSDFGGTFNPEVGLQWYPVKGLLARISYGTGFRAPSLFELNEIDQTFPTTVVDPRRHNEVDPISLVSGGNSNLNPEKSRSLTIGTVFTPSTIPGFRAELTWWRISEDNRILQVPFQTLVADEALFPGAVTRSAPTPADVAAGLPGKITAITNVFLNSGTLLTDGADFNLSYQLQTKLGNFASSVGATWVHKFDSAIIPGAPIQELVGIAQPLGSIPRWRAFATVDWSRQNVGATISGHFISSYQDINSTGLLWGHVIKAQFPVDAQVWVRLPRMFGGRTKESSGTTLRFGAVDVFNELPSFAAVHSLGYDPTQSDIRGRFVYAQLSEKF